MGKKIAIAVIHGMGKQNKPDDQTSDILSFSKDLHKRVSKKIGAAKFNETVAWREIYWADVLQERQNIYLDKIKGVTRYKKLRGFVLSNLSDAASYRKTSDVNDNTYSQIHNKVAATIKELDNDTDDDAVLIVVAHSLGCHIMSSYIYDMQSGSANVVPKPKSDFQKMKRMGGLVTFGCPIPIFMFSIPDKHIKPISFPGTALPLAQQKKPWWKNYYDRDDILGYPLCHISESYLKLRRENQMVDTAIDVGDMAWSWNPMSHNWYWKDRHLSDPLAAFIESF